MSVPQEFLRQQNDVVLSLLDEIKHVSADAAATDDAGRWGIDGWIKVVHDLLDAQLRALAAITEATLEGPWWRRPQAGAAAQDTLRVGPERPYARSIDIVESFRRIGTSDEPIPDHLVTITPVALPANEVGFTLKVPDEFTGGNYVGKLRFSRLGEGPDTSPEHQTFIIGL